MQRGEYDAYSESWGFNAAANGGGTDRQTGLYWTKCSENARSITLWYESGKIAGLLMLFHASSTMPIAAAMQLGKPPACSTIEL